MRGIGYKALETVSTNGYNVSVGNQAYRIALVGLILLSDILQISQVLVIIMFV